MYSDSCGLVILLSGGLDSSTALHHTAACHPGKPLYCLSFNYGQRHDRELECARRQVAACSAVREHQVMDLAFLGGLIGQASALVRAGQEVPDMDQLAPEDMDQPVTYVPNRNMILLSLAAAYAESRGCTGIVYGAQAQDHYGYWDCTSEFLLRINEVLNLNRRTPVVVQAPFVGMSKAQVIQIGLALGVDYAATWTCYRGGAKPCLSCPSCKERLGAFAALGLQDPSH